MTDAQNTHESHPDLERASATASSLRESIAGAFLGQEQVVEQVLVTLLAGGHALLEGVPGLGKTLLVRALAASFGGEFGRVQFTPDLMPTDVTGHAVYDMASSEFRVRKGPAFTQLFLADEINRAPAKTQAALLEVMQERQITLEGESYKVQEPFAVFATQNPIEQEGTYPLPEAQPDRFLMLVRMDSPGEDEELAIVRHVTLNATGVGLPLDGLRAVVSAEQVVAAQAAVAKVRVDEEVARYAVRITRATREARGLSLGAGPRGGIALVRAARARALLRGRDFVAPEDIKALACPVLRHRISLAPELAFEGGDTDSVLLDILEQVEAPRA